MSKAHDGWVWNSSYVISRAAAGWEPAAHRLPCEQHRNGHHLATQGALCSGPAERPSPHFPGLQNLREPGEGLPGTTFLEAGKGQAPHGRHPTPSRERQHLSLFNLFLTSKGGWDSSSPSWESWVLVLATWQDSTLYPALLSVGM